MKTLRRIMMAMFALAFIGMTVACTDKEDDNGGNNNANDPNGYSAKLVGTWKIDQLSSNGQDMTEYLPNIKLSFSANGQGMMDDDGETQNNDFTWEINGEIITVKTHNTTMNFTISSLTDNQCTFRGDFMEIDGNQLQNVVIHMTKVTPPPVLEPGDDDLVGMSFGMTIPIDFEEIHYEMSISMVFTTASTGQMEMSDEEDTEFSPFTYTYHSATKQGKILMEEEGEYMLMPFTYDPEQDAITLINPEYNPQDPDDMEEIVLPRITEE